MIKDVRPGDLVVGANGLGGTSAERVLDVLDQGTAPAWHYRFRPGRARSGLVDLVTTEKTQALQCLKMGDRWPKLRMPHIRSLGEPHPRMGLFPAAGLQCGQVGDPRAFLLGALMGNGCTSSNVTLTTADNELAESLNASLQCVGWKLLPIVRNRRSGMPSYEFTVRDLTVAMHRRSGVRQWLEEIGFYGLKAWEKRVPEVCRTWTNDAIAELLTGYAATDGSSPKLGSGSHLTGMIWSSTSRGMLEDVQELLLSRFGIYANIRSFGRVGKTASQLVYGYEITQRHKCWVLVVCSQEGVRRLCDVLQPVCGKVRKFLDGNAAAPAPVRDERLVLRYVDRTFLGDRHMYDLVITSRQGLFVLGNGAIVVGSCPPPIYSRPTRLQI
jgi:hypothetical protein